MNISGLSGATLETLIENGFIQSYADIYHLDRFQKEIEALDVLGLALFQRYRLLSRKARMSHSRRSSLPLESL